MSPPRAPAKRPAKGPVKRPAKPKAMAIPADVRDVELDFGGGKVVRLTNLDKPFWPDLTKGDLIQYYVDVAPWLLPHLEIGRAHV